MPIYEYLCEACGTLTERMQKVGEAGPRKCPECGSRKIAKMVSRTSFQLKGGGWYADLYASPRPDGAKSGTHAPAAEGTAVTPADAKAGAKPEPKPDAKPEPKPDAKPEPKAAASPEVTRPGGRSTSSRRRRPA